MERVSDQSILDEAERQRAHEQKIAKIEAERDAKVAHERRCTAESRHVTMAIIGGILAGLSLLVTIALIWAYNVDQDRQNREEREQRDDAVAELCIRSGNLWVSGDCLIANRE